MALIRTVNCKAPAELDFYRFFHLIDHNTRNNILRRHSNVLPSLFLYSSDNQTVTIYYLVSTDPLSVEDLFFQITKENPHHYHVITYAGWGAEERSLKKYQYGDIAKLPPEKKKEQLVIMGKSRDGKEARTVTYDIIRARCGDDSSRVLSFEKYIDSADQDCLTVSRPEYLDLIQQMFRTALVNQDNRPWIIYQNSRTPIPILDDINKCLHTRKLLPEIVPGIIGIIRDMVHSKSRTDSTTRIVDSDGNALSTDELVEKYFRNPREGVLH